MAFKKMLIAAVASALVASPVLAAASEGSALSLQPAPEAVKGGSTLNGGSGTIWAVILGGVILTGFILAAIDNIDDDDDVPVSP